jgi:SAM-dependent methyltransferase
MQRQFRDWMQQPLGRLIAAMEQAELNATLPDLFGYHLIQVGARPGDGLTAGSRISHCVVLDDEAGAGEAGLYARPDALPIGADCVDVVLLPHTLEFAHDPHNVLREAERVLVPEGHVVILAFNPWSLWGLWRLVLKRRGHAPWRSRFFSVTRIKDWLALLGFDTVQTRHYFFRPPIGHAGFMHRLQFLERLGGRWWPVLGGACQIVARKRVSTLTPIKPRWKSARSLVGAGLAEPTRRNCHHDR